MARRLTNSSEGGAVPLLAGRYELLRTQETDSNSASILGWDQRLKRWRSIRIARPGDEEAGNRLIASAQRAAKLEHPNLERVIDVGRDGSIAFVVRDRFVCSVAQHLSRRGAVPPGWAARATARCAEGLAWAHPRGIVHGHPRPDVVLFAEDGEAVITHFGQRATLRDDEETRLGAPWAHLAPELRQYWEPTAATDIYALGALLYTMLTGHHSAELFYAEAYEGMLSQVPRTLRPVVLKACAFEPTERYASAVELQEILDAKLPALPPVQEPPPWLESTQEFPDRNALADPDAIIDDVASLLGTPAPPGRTAVVSESDQATTLQQEEPEHAPLPYTMPAAPSADQPPAEPDYLAPEPDYLAPEPDYLSAESESGEAALVIPEPEYITPDLPSRGSESDYGTSEPDYLYDYGSVPPAEARRTGPRTIGTGAPGMRVAAPPRPSRPLPPDEDDDPESQPGFVRWVALAFVGGLAMVGMLVAVTFVMATTEERSDVVFVEAVAAEEAAMSSWVLKDAELKELWERFRDSSSDTKAHAAADLVGAASAKAERAPELVPHGVDRSLQRLGDAWEDWQVSQ